MRHCCVGSKEQGPGGGQGALFLCPQGRGMAMRLAASLFSRIQSCLQVGSPVMRVRVPWGIWALMNSAETVSAIGMIRCKHKEVACGRCQ